MKLSKQNCVLTPFTLSWVDKSMIVNMLSFVSLLDWDPNRDLLHLNKFLPLLRTQSLKFTAWKKKTPQCQRNFPLFVSIPFRVRETWTTLYETQLMNVPLHFLDHQPPGGSSRKLILLQRSSMKSLAEVLKLIILFSIFNSYEIEY